jgi:uncharacterized membrane protein
VSALLLPVVLLANGLAAGVLLGTLLGGFPYLAVLAPDRYVHAHAFFSTRYDPFMPVCLLVTVFGSAGLAAPAGHPGARLLHLAAAVLAAGTVAISLTRNVPTNRLVRRLDPERLPAGFDPVGVRRSWGRWNTRRSWLAVAALTANGAALALTL